MVKCIVHHVVHCASFQHEWQGVSGCDDPQAYDYKDFFPPADHGNVLITTRLSRLQRGKASLRMGAVDNDIGREMLKSRIGRELPVMYICERVWYNRYVLALLVLNVSKDAH
jgi:hypothetical protein